MRKVQTRRRKSKQKVAPDGGDGANETAEDQAEVGQLGGGETSERADDREVEQGDPGVASRTGEEEEEGAAAENGAGATATAAVAEAATGPGAADHEGSRAEGRDDVQASERSAGLEAHGGGEGAPDVGAGQGRGASRGEGASGREGGWGALHFTASRSRDRSKGKGKGGRMSVGGVFAASRQARPAAHGRAGRYVWAWRVCAGQGVGGGPAAAARTGVVDGIRGPALDQHGINAPRRGSEVGGCIWHGGEVPLLT